MKRHQSRKQRKRVVSAAIAYALLMRDRSGEGSYGYPASYIYELRRVIEKAAVGVKR